MYEKTDLGECRKVFPKTGNSAQNDTQIEKIAWPEAIRVFQKALCHGSAGAPEKGLLSPEARHTGERQDRTDWQPRRSPPNRRSSSSGRTVGGCPTDGCPVDGRSARSRYNPSSMSSVWSWRWRVR